MNAQCPVAWQMTNFTYRGAIGHVQDPKAGIAIREIGNGADNVDAPRLARGRQSGVGPLDEA